MSLAKQKLSRLAVLIFMYTWTLHVAASAANFSSRQLLGLRGVNGDLSFEGKDNRTVSHDPESVLLQDDRATVMASFPSNLTVPLHAHSGTHHVHVYIGSPPQRQTLIVDTGSRVMAFPCKSCKSCGNHASPYFDPARSTTQRTSKCGRCRLEGIATCSLFGDHCEITQKYTEGSSWSASEVEDMVWIGTANVVESIESYMQLAIPYAFGCQTQIKGLFQKQYADGILGLARHETSLVAALHNSKVIQGNIFSLCLTLDAGYLSVGGSMPEEYHNEQMQMTPITREHGWYSVEIIRLLVGDIEVATEEMHTGLLQAMNSGKGCILDSGTTDTYLPEKLSKPVARAAMTFTDGLSDFSEHTRVKSYSYAEYERLPNLTFEMRNNATLIMEPRHYMEGITLGLNNEVLTWKGTKTLTNRVYLDEAEGAVLGANAMFGYDILFDSQSNQVGIAKANCAALLTSSSSN